MDKAVFFFGNGKAEAGREDRDLLGGKGANQMEMTNLGVPVPPGFTIACDLCDTNFAGSNVSEGLHAEVDRGIYPEDPFEVLDVDGVGKLVSLATADGRATRPALKVGICGEHGGEPKSVAFCHDVGLDNVSCSPFRVPSARLSAAQAVKA